MTTSGKPATALTIDQVDELTERQQSYFDKCTEKLGFIPNVLKAYAFSSVKLQAFADLASAQLPKQCQQSKDGTNAYDVFTESPNNLPVQKIDNSRK